MIYRLIEDQKEVKKFTQQEFVQIINEKLDYTAFFKQPDSKEKLTNIALNGREISIGFKQPKDF